VDGDGTNEYLFIGDSYYFCQSSPAEIPTYNTPYILNGDRTRWKVNGFNWEIVPVGPPQGTAKLYPPAPALGSYYTTIQAASTHIVAADIDGDGVQEIIFPSYDGYMHVFWADTRTEQHNWPLELKTLSPSGSYVYASEPIVADLDNDGTAEIIFTSYHQYETGEFGYIVIVDYQGTVQYKTGIFQTKTCDFYGDSSSQCNYKNEGDWGGAMAAPTIANIDHTADYEVITVTVGSGIVTYTIPGSSNARILWGTGRGNYQRAGGVKSPPVGKKKKKKTSPKKKKNG